MTTASAPPGSTTAQRMAAGKLLRDTVPRSSHSAWNAPADRLDPLRLLEASSRGRVDRLIPLRNARMAQSAFAFYRGTAAVMAADLAQTPVTGLRVQLCGDAHCLNFGVFATPERRVIFDVNDFDETSPGPWEWDVKRLAASLVLAARQIKLKDGGANLAVLAAVRSYRTQMLAFAEKSALATWYARIDIPEGPPSSEADERRRRKQILESARTHSMEAAVEKITAPSTGGRRFIDDPPLMYHAASEPEGAVPVDRVLATYTESLTPEVRVLFERYALVDSAFRAVGVGSVGTRCLVALMQAEGGDAIILQIKEAMSSVLERYTAPSAFTNHGQRVVRGQRLMQSASDALLGWGTTGDRDFYVRQYKDKKGAVDISQLDGFGLREYASLCGQALATAHARSGDAAQIAGYLGKADTFDKAIVRFGVLYADQAEDDYTLFMTAVNAGKIVVA